MAGWESQLTFNERQSLQASVLYGDLYYETPGGLTKTEYLAKPARGEACSRHVPGADQAKAGIRQQTFLAGITHNYAFSDAFENTTTVYGAFSILKDPTFRNYEKRSEPTFWRKNSFHLAKTAEQRRAAECTGRSRSAAWLLQY